MKKVYVAATDVRGEVWLSDTQGLTYVQLESLTNRVRSFGSLNTLTLQMGEVDYHFNVANLISVCVQEVK